MNIIHEEKQKFNLFFGMLMLGSFVIICVYLFLNWQRGELGRIPLFILVILVGIMVLDLFMIINFYQLKTMVTEDKLIFGFGVLQRKVPIEEIEEVTVEKLDFKRYMGYGIRVGRDKSVGYIARAGNGVRIKIRNKKDFFITSNNAEQLKTMLETAGKKIAGISH